MRLFAMPIMIILFVLYILHLAIVKKDLKSNLHSTLYPGLFFIGVWILIYYVILS